MVVKLVPPRQKVPFDAKGFLAKAGAGRRIEKYIKDEIIFAQGAACSAVFFIQKGRVKITVVSELGKEAVIAVMSANDFIGESALTGAPLRISSATAMGDVTLVRLERKAITRLMRDEPRFADFFISHLLTRNARVEADLVDQLFNASEKRLARTLLLLANFGNDAKEIAVMPKISQEMLADMVGTTRSRVSFFMNRFRKLGFISYNGGIKVHRSLLNAILTDKPKIKRS